VDEMTTTDFKSVDDFWEWHQIQLLKEFRYLIDEYGFVLVKSEIAPTQCSVEWEKGDLRIGVWSSYGSRPEVFVKSRGKRVFSNQILAKCAKRLRFPVEGAAFGERTVKKDYQMLFVTYSTLVKFFLRADLDAR